MRRKTTNPQVLDPWSALQTKEAPGEEADAGIGAGTDEGSGEDSGKSGSGDSGSRIDGGDGELGSGGGGSGTQVEAEGMGTEQEIDTYPQSQGARDAGDGGAGGDGGHSGGKDASKDGNAQAKRPKPALWHEMNKNQRKHWKARHW